MKNIGRYVLVLYNIFSWEGKLYRVPLATDAHPLCEPLNVKTTDL